ncbi:LysE family transporter [Pectobacterium carotovorum]|nr:LysE family transporter [Pectobacterium carotovorum]
MTLTESLIAFTFAATLLTLTPGLDTALILRTATVEGSKKAFHAAFGINVGCLIWGAMVAFGLGTLIAATRPLSRFLRRGSVVKWMDRTTGVIFLAFAARLVLSRR